MRSLQEQIIYAANIKPSPRQLAWQELEFYAFIHFGINTFTDKEWGDGQDAAQIFLPTDFDADQWVNNIKKAGMRGLILTCKHHDGFCLWPSAYTEYSVKNSLWGDGNGDVVKEVARACQSAGLKFGVYLSPWDRHDERYGQGKAYDDYFVQQLTELATNYGDIFCFWFDGACGEGKNGKKQVYDWERYYQVIRNLQAGAVISICGPDVRWCGNEAGHCRESEWSVVPAELLDAERIAEKSQHVDDGQFSRHIDSQDEDLASRKIIANKAELIWYPAEVDTSIRPGWFYHASEDNQVRSANELFAIYLASVGANASLLLNIPPNKQGLIAEADCRALADLGEKINALFHDDVTAKAEIKTNSAKPAHPISLAVDPANTTYWQAEASDLPTNITLIFPNEQLVSTVVLGEQLLTGQRIEAGEIWADSTKVCDFTVVGHKRICTFPARRLHTLRIVLSSTRAEATLRLLRVYS